MRINRNMLLKLANDAVDKSVLSDRSIMAIYLQGSLLSDDPLIGNTADIDLFFIHIDEVSCEREIIRISDEVHLDIAHHSRRLYSQPRELRLHPWLGPAVYGCKILYDPQHFIDFTQASVRGQFNNPANVIARAQKQAIHAREMWEGLYEQTRAPSIEDTSLYLRALEHAANVIAGLNGSCLTERRFLTQLQQFAETLHKPGLQAGFLGLLGASKLDVEQLRVWLIAWQNAYANLPGEKTPIRLHPHRMLYYEKAIEAMLAGHAATHALWPLWRTWTDMISLMSEDAPHRSAWQDAGEILGLRGESFRSKIEGLDAYLDQIEELLESWARDNGV